MFLGILFWQLFKLCWDRQSVVTAHKEADAVHELGVMHQDKCRSLLVCPDKHHQQQPGSFEMVVVNAVMIMVTRMSITWS